jgi:hypothetical protein
MKLLIKQGIDFGQSAHIPDAQGRPLCKARLKRAAWVVDDQQRTAVVVCHPCLRVQAKYEERRMQHVACINESVARLVQGVLLHHGVRSSHQGPGIRSGPTITIVPIGAIDSEEEADIRRAIQRIAGATIVG